MAVAAGVVLVLVAALHNVFYDMGLKNR